MESKDGPPGFDYRGAFESLPAVAFAVERGPGGEWRIAAANAMQRSALGLAGGADGRPISELLPAAVAVAAAARYDDCLRSGAAQEYEEYAGPPIDRWFNTALAPFPGAGAGVLLGVTRDITERERQRALAERGEARFRELAEMLPEAVYETDAEARFTYVNSAGLALFGYAREELGGPLRAGDMFAPGEAARAMAVRARTVAEGRSARVEYLARRKDGSTFPAMIHTVPVVEGDRVVGTRGVVVDLTERKREEEIRLRADKLHSLGLLAGGIAHDFNNMLTAMLGDISIALLEGGLGPEGRRVLLEAQGAVGRAKGLTRQLLALAAGGPPEKRGFDLGRLLRECASFTLSGSAASASVEVGEGIGEVAADEGQLSQAVGNLLLNSLQAMGGAGKIKVSARLVSMGAGNDLLLAPGPYAAIVVEDSGPGIPPDALPRMFDPYFTTKSAGHGLGLATVYSIMRRHGGTAHAESPRGGGALFSLYLPLDAAIEPPRDAAPAGAAPRERGRILVLEDEGSIRGYLKSLFRHYGYDHAMVEDGAAAVEAYGEALARGEPFDVVFLDLTVPGGMGGKECLERLRLLDPGVRAVMTSGYAAEAAATGYREASDAREGAELPRARPGAGFEAFLPKPYQPGELDAVLQRALASRRERA